MYVTKHFFYALVVIILLGVIVDKANANEYGYIELKQGVTLGNLSNSGDPWLNKYPTSIAIGHHWDMRGGRVYTRIQLEHISNILDGPPFNDNNETTLDWINVTIGVRF